MELTLIIIHILISVILIVSVLMQHGKQQGLSGAIAGGAETFFGKNKGKTLDGILQKVTSVVAILFVVSSIVLVVYTTGGKKTELPESTEVVDTNAGDAAEADTTATEGEATEGDAIEGETAEGETEKAAE
ncbi:MAG: preprotein translocase subunit SecG [Ruminococcaceae bacterium]|nr:preprotein translocase subunit SecG [Oscillospiraceae bacterium]